MTRRLIDAVADNGKAKPRQGRARRKTDEYPEDRRGDAWEPPPAEEYDGDQSIDTGLVTGTADLGGAPWPEPPRPAAYHGLAGEIVRTIEPHSEADPVALLVQVLTAFGSITGRRAHFIAEDDRHYLNLFAVLVGRTSKGRKGSSWSRVRRLTEDVDAEWAAQRVQGGLSSGEGLIYAVRDPVSRTDKQTGQMVETDEGVPDKRLLAYEAEFALVLKNIERQGNTLSATIRQAWDTGALRSLVKNSPIRATGAHISIIGHCTAEELRRYLSTTEAANGFGNRFLWLCVRRSKVLPEGGALCPEALSNLVVELRRAADFGGDVDTIRRDEAARARWREVYTGLSEGRPGMTGAILARAEAQVMRLACVYALLDRSCLVEPEHLEAALALWDFCERSAEYVFGDSLGDPVADDILRALRAAPGGLTRTDLREHFSRNRRAGEIGRALGLLLQYRRATFRKETSGGAPSERWFATQRGTP